MEWNYDMDFAPRDGSMVWLLHPDGATDALYWREGDWCKNVGWPVAYSYRLDQPVAFYMLPAAPAMPVGS